MSMFNRIISQYLIPGISRSNLFQNKSSLLRINPNFLMMDFKFSTVDELTVEHDYKNRQFFIKLGKDKATLHYKNLSPGVLDLYHTEVPQQLRGHGIAQKLAEKAFSYVSENNLKMLVTCTYLQKYLKDHPNEEFQSRIVK